MNFRPGNIIKRHQKDWRVVDFSGVRLIIECLKTYEVKSLSSDEAVDELMNQTITMNSEYPASEQRRLTDKDWKKILFREPYARAFSQKNVTREDFDTVIFTIKQEHGHDRSKKYPSRPTVYRWAALLSRNNDRMELR